MRWYVIHTKLRQEQLAFENLSRQGFECYLPTVSAERVQQRVLVVVIEPLFPRYLFIRLDDAIDSGKSWSPIRSTKGVSRLVAFGGEPAKVPDRLVDLLRELAGGNSNAQPKRLFEAGEKVRIDSGPFAGIEGIYQMTDGTARAFVLIELISTKASLAVEPGQLKKLS
ncbi:MAG: transcription/translation regulatory transformer protein RfaH [Betaproteobacteria bacterium]